MSDGGPPTCPLHGGEWVRSGPHRLVGNSLERIGRAEYESGDFAPDEDGWVGGEEFSCGCVLVERREDDD